MFAKVAVILLCRCFDTTTHEKLQCVESKGQMKLNGCKNDDSHTLLITKVLNNIFYETLTEPCQVCMQRIKPTD